MKIPLDADTSVSYNGDDMQKHADSGKELYTQRAFYTLRQLAEILGVSERTMSELLQTGKVHGLKLKGQWRISDVELQRLRAPKEEVPPMVEPGGVEDAPAVEPLPPEIA